MRKWQLSAATIVALSLTCLSPVQAAIGVATHASELSTTVDATSGNPLFGPITLVDVTSPAYPTPEPHRQSRVNSQPDPSSAPEPPDAGGDQSGESAIPTPFRTTDTPRKSIAFWPQGGLSGPQDIEVQVSASAPIRGTYFFGSPAGIERGSYRTEGRESWTAIMRPNNSGMVHGVAVVFVSRDRAKLPATAKNPRGQMQCKILVNGVTVASVAVPYDDVDSRIECRVRGEVR